MTDYDWPPVAEPGGGIPYLLKEQSMPDLNSDINDRVREAARIAKATPLTEGELADTAAAMAKTGIRGVTPEQGAMFIRIFRLAQEQQNT